MPKLMIPLLLMILIFPRPSSSLTLGTYNLKNMENKEGLKEDLAQLEKVDIFAFQEVKFNQNGPNENERSQFLREIIPYSYRYLVTQVVAQDDNGNWEGHALVSKYPILRTKAISLKHTGTKNRMALIAWIQVKGTEVMVVNTDHEVDYKSISYFDRLKQIESLFEVLTNYPTKAPQIVLGDFNTSDSIANWFYGIDGNIEVQLTYQHFEEQGFITSYPLDGEKTTFEIIGFITQHLDHIFLKNVTRKTYLWERLHQRQGSDHYPIFLTLDL